MTFVQLDDASLESTWGGVLRDDGTFFRDPVSWEENGMRFQGWLTTNTDGGTTLDGYVTSGGWDPRIEYSGASWGAGEEPQLSLEQGQYGIVSE